MAAAKTDQKVSATVALPGVQVETLNPYGHSTTQIYPTWKHVIEPLIEWNWSKKRIVPILAESWSNPDPSTWLFKLKKGIKFHDGSEFTSADVVHSFTRIQKDPDSKQVELHRPCDRHRGGGPIDRPVAHEESGCGAAVPPGAALYHQ